MNDPALIVRLPLQKRIFQLWLNVRTILRTRKWRLFLRLVATWIQMKFFKGTPLRYTDIAVTYGCNLHCIHCSATRFTRSRQTPLSQEDYRKLADQLRELGVVQIDFTGGEPTFFKDLESLIPLFRPSSTFISISTNGVGPLPEDQLARFRTIGVDALVISIDSIDPEEHDAFRQKQGAWAETWETIDRAKRMGFTVVVCTVAHHQNVQSEGLEDLIELTRKKGLIMNLAQSVSAGNWSQNGDYVDRYQLTHEDKVYTRTLLKRHNHLRLDFGTNLKQWGCPAAVEKIYLTPYGDVLPCPFIQISFGNVHDTSMADIRKKMLAETRVSHYFNQCLAAEDQDFIHKYLSKTYGDAEVPVASESVFD